MQLFQGCNIAGGGGKDGIIRMPGKFSGLAYIKVATPGDQVRACV